MYASKKLHSRVFIAMQLALILSLATSMTTAADQKGTKNADQVMTEAELQGKLMAFADRYWSTLNSAGIEYLEKRPSSENSRMILSQLVHSAADAFTIAAGPNPVAAFLDMVVMVSLGRMVFEQHYAKLYGAEVTPIVEGFRKAEADIWRIASEILTVEQQRDLMSLIERWRRNNPKNIVFSSVRFSEFEKFRGSSDDSKKSSSGGIFPSVAEATEQVEKMRLLAERAMYLSSRLPMMTGAFADVWASRLTRNQDVGQILIDLNRIADGLQRVAAVSEKLPDDIARERDTTINMLMQEVARQRRQTLEDFLAEEKRIRGLLTDLKSTLISANDLLISTNSIVDRLSFGQGEVGQAALSKPLDIKDYQTTLEEASTAIEALHELVKTIDQMGLENKMPEISKAIEKIGRQGQKWVLQGFMLGVVLILIFLGGSVLAMISYRYVAQKMLSTDKKEGRQTPPPY